MGLYDALWNTGFKRTITSTAGLIIAVAGAVTAIPPAWSMLELPVVATRAFVLGETSPIKLAQSDMARGWQQVQLQNLQSSLYAAKLDQAKNPGVQTIDQRVQDLEEQIKQIKATINAGQH